MKTISAISAAVLAAMVGTGLSTVAFAETGARGDKAAMPMFDFDQLDADKDGKVTLEEMQAARAARIAEMDADKDGKISEAELNASHLRGLEARAADRAKRMIERLDTDADGMLSAAELAASERPASRMFQRIDADGDGAISKAEAEAARDRMAEHRDGRGKKKGHGKDMGRGGQMHGQGNN